MCISKKPRKFVDVLDVLSFRENLEILGDNGFLHVYLHGCAGCVLCATFAAPGAKGSNVRENLWMCAGSGISHVCVSKRACDFTS